MPAESTWAFECTANTRRGHDSDSVGLADYRTADRRRRLQGVGGALTIGTRKTGTRGVADEVERERDVAGGGPAKEPLAREIGDGRGIDVEIDDRDGGRSDREEEVPALQVAAEASALDVADDRRFGDAFPVAAEGREANW